MFKRLFGIHKIEKKIDGFTDSLVRSWGWIKHLNNITELYEERIKRLEQSNIQLIELTSQLIGSMEEEEYEEVEEQKQQLVSSRIELPNKDIALMQILYQYAAFDRNNAVSTQEVYNNLTYKITERGLRKKLMSLIQSGLINSIKKGNTRHWFINTGSLAKIKKAIKEKEE